MKETPRAAKLLLLILILSMFAGCSRPQGEQGVSASGKTTLVIGNMPDESEPDRLALYDELLKKMRDKYPDIEVKTDHYAYSVQTFMAKAESGQLPTVYETWFTEIPKIIEAGYAADLTDIMNSKGYAQAVNPDLMELISENGRIYAVPVDVYAQGLLINKNLFEKAGLVNSDGSFAVPKTYDELAQTAQLIKERTGAAGFIMPGSDNCGGWHFMNIAWSYGAQFVDKIDGKWTAMFDTPECVQALQYVKDLKWKYNALPDNIFLDMDGITKAFATDQGAMMISNPPNNPLIANYDMKKENLLAESIPRGPAGRYAQMGGNVHMIAPNATPAQIDAAFKWMELIGETADISDDVLDSLERRFASQRDMGWIVLNREPFDIWVNDQRQNKVNELRGRYTNIDPRDYENYYAFEGVVISPEPAVAAQELYHLLDGCIQEVLSNEDADCGRIISKAAKDYQENYLNRIER